MTLIRIVRLNHFHSGLNSNNKSINTSNLPSGKIPSVGRPATSNQQPATSNQQPAISNQQPATSNQQPATSNQQPATMYTSETKVRVRYAETDQMRYVYYGNYAIYFEVGRTEALRKLGLSYRSLEEGGIMLPAIEYNVKFLKPVFYDEELTIKTIIKELPKVRIKFFYEVFNEKGELVCTADTTLVFVNMKNNRPCAAPSEFLGILMKYFS